MDQVKIYLAVLKKYHFWLLAAMAALIGIVCWWMGKSSLASQTTANQSTVEGKYKTISALNGKLPNASFSEETKKLNDTLKTEVFADWKQHYEDQQKLFKWPDVDGVKDIATQPQPLSSTTRQMYKELVFPGELDRLFKLANVRMRATKNKDEDSRAAPDAPAAEAEEPVEDGLVVWDSSHRDALSRRYDFVHKQVQEISEIDLRTAQEDIWVLEQLAKIIVKTNEGATDEAALAVKRIAALDVAQWAVDASQQNPPILRLPKPAAPASAAAATAPAATPPAAGGEEGSAPAAPDAQQRADSELLDGRYLNDANQPASADDVPFTEFKRIFVRMKLDVDQRKLNDLLVNCANSELPLDVLRVRVDLPLLSTEKATTAPGSAARSPNTVAQEIIPSAYDVPVEICGLMQIYNVPDETKLAQGTGDPTKRSLDMPELKVRLPRISMSRGPAK